MTSSTPSRFSTTNHQSASNDADGLVNSILSGFIATFAMSLATFGAYGISRALADQSGNQLQRWFWMLTHNDMINSTQNRLVLAIGLDLLVGVAFGVVYGFGVDRRMDGPGWRNGMLFSLIPWLLSILVFFPVMHAGIFGRDLHAGPLPVIGNLILHLIFGAVLGWPFRSISKVASAPRRWTNFTIISPTAGRWSVWRSAFRPARSSGGYRRTACRISRADRS